MKCMITPTITGVAGIVTKGLKENLEVIPGKKDMLGFYHMLNEAHIH